jgi:hypothetical protein
MGQVLFWQSTCSRVSLDNRGVGIVCSGLLYLRRLPPHTKPVAQCLVYEY